MKKFSLAALASVGMTSPAFAMAHNSTTITGLWSLIVRVGNEIECMLETTLFALQLLLTGQWFALANLGGICTTAVNSVFFTNPWVAVATTAVLTILTLVLAFLALRWMVRRIKTTSNPFGLHAA